MKFNSYWLNVAKKELEWAKIPKITLVVMPMLTYNTILFLDITEFTHLMREKIILRSSLIVMRQLLSIILLEVLLVYTVLLEYLFLIIEDQL